jgi:single-strand DNA-binding protein
MIEAHFRGNLGGDPETYQAGAQTVTRFRAAEYQSRRDDTAEQEPVWVAVEVWGDQGERCADLLRKGDPVLISGRWMTQSWEADDGTKRSKTFVRAFAVGPDLSRCTVRGVSRLSRREPTDQPNDRANDRQAGEVEQTQQLASVGAAAAVDPFDEE